MTTQWWLSTEMIGKVGSQKEAGPFSTRDDAFVARVALEKRGANLSVFEEEVDLTTSVPTDALRKLREVHFRSKGDACVYVHDFLAAIGDKS